MISNDVAALVADFWAWAWARHANELSWYIRPLFLVPLALAAYRRSGWGVAASILAMLSSMFWFPAPHAVDPRIREFLAFEQEWLLGSWSVGKVALSLLVPISLVAYCVAFWQRSLRWGLVLLTAIALGKMVWSAVSSSGGSATLVPATLGLVIAVPVIAVVVRWPQARASLAARRQQAGDG